MSTLMNKEQKSYQKSRWVAIVIQLLSVVLTCALGLSLVINQSHRSLNQALLDFFCFEFVWLIGIYLAIIVHEVGHVVAGLRGGMEFRQMLVGPIGLSNSGLKSELFWNRHRTTGGFAYMILPDEGDTVGILELFVKGGPVASLIYTTLLSVLFIALFLSDQTTEACMVGSLLCGAFFTLTGSVFPYTARGTVTDALVLKRLCEPGPMREMVVANFVLSKEMSAGIRPRYWTESAVQAGLTHADDPVDRLRALYVAYTFYGDRVDSEKEIETFHQAQKLVDQYREDLGILTEIVWLEEAYRLASIYHDPVSARQRLNWCKSKSDALQFGRYLVEASIAVEEGDRHTAMQWIKRSEDALVRAQRRTGCNTETGYEALNKLEKRLLETEVLANPSAYLTES